MANIFHPRYNKKIFKPEYYDSNYSVIIGSGPDMSNPYEIGSQNPYERWTAYIWGRWHEAGTFGNNSWNCNSDIGNIVWWINTQSTAQNKREIYDFWWDASIFDYTQASTGDQYYYRNLDNINRYPYPTKVGQIVTFRDENVSPWVLQPLCAGVVEIFTSFSDYWISILDVYSYYEQHTWPTDPDPIILVHVLNNQWVYPINHLQYPGRAIDNYFSTKNNDPIVIGKPIGWRSKALLYSKRYNDIRKGNDL